MTRRGLVVAAAFALSAGFAFAAEPKCVPAAMGIQALSEKIPGTTFLHVPELDVAPIKGFFAQEGATFMSDAEGFIAASLDRGIAFFPVRGGQLCDGQGFLVAVTRVPELRSLVNGWRLRHGALPHSEVERRA